MSRHYLFYSPLRRSAQTMPRRGLTLVEILISVALMTILMLAAIRILAYVSSSLTQATSAMNIATLARTAQLQIERDLACITAPLTPPLRFDDAPGYLCIIEGLGSHYGKLFHDGKIGWAVEDIAVNSETGKFDSTVGDCDDILMFTARAPGDTMYRGLVGGVVTESKEAEICYFLRGTTLYRRVLLIIPDEQLQAALRETRYDGNYSARNGYGFYRDFDVSGRLEGNVIKANTLADLTRRENRFAHANQPVGSGTLNPFPYGIHNLPIWYQLRLPTLAECTMAPTATQVGCWRAGLQVTRLNMLLNLRYDDPNVESSWVGKDVMEFPIEAGRPCIDFWNNPLPWNGEGALDPATQSLTAGSGIYAPVALSDSSNFRSPRRVNDDVLLTNVLSFDIKVWCPIRKEFIDLGGYKKDFQLVASDSNEARKFSRDLGSQGFFGRLFATSGGCYSNDGTYRYGLLPCVYDTWTDAYENDATRSVWDSSGREIEGIGVEPPPGYEDITDIMEHVDKWRCPPPYNVPLTGIQIKIRVFDPDTKNIREVTIRRNFN